MKYYVFTYLISISRISRSHFVPILLILEFTWEVTYGVILWQVFEIPRVRLKGFFSVPEGVGNWD